MFLVDFSILTYTLNMVFMRKRKTVKSTCQGIVLHNFLLPQRQEVEGASALWFRGWEIISKNNKSWGEEVIFGRVIFVDSFLQFFSFLQLLRFFCFSWRNCLVVKVLNSKSRGPVFKTTCWLQGWLCLSSFEVRYNEYQEFLSIVVKSNLPPRNDSSLEAVEPYV